MDSQHTLPAMDSQYMQSHAAKHKKKAKLEMKLHRKNDQLHRKMFVLITLYSEMFVSFLYMNMFCAVHAIRRLGDLMKNPPLTLDWFHDVLFRSLLPIRTKLMEQQATQN
jgi:hypothetical protein